MLKKLGSLIGYVVFACILVTSLMRINRILEITWVEHDRQVSVASQDSFYETAPNSLDVLFVGTSHTYYSFSPQMLYDEYGITSHNLGTSAQPVLASRWWIEEALRYQRPKAVILETFAFPWEADSDRIRDAMSGMRWGSGTKFAAMMDTARVFDADPSEYLLSNMLFHDRWDGLQQDDFTGTMCARELRGYMPSFWSNGGDDYIPLSPDGGGVEPTEMPKETMSQVDAIYDICQKHEVPLILVTVPSKSWSQADHNMVAEYVSDKDGIEYYDLGCSGLYENIGFDYAADEADAGGHANVEGAAKMTDWVGRLLKFGEYGVEAHEDEAFEATKGYWQQVIAEGELMRTTDIGEYIDKIDLSTHVVFIASPDEMEPSVVEAGNKWLESLGLEPTDGAFVAVASDIETNDDGNGDGGKPKKAGLREVDSTKLVGVFENGLVGYRLDCSGKLPSILLTDGNGVNSDIMPTDDGKKWRGLVLVTYDPAHQVMCDRVLLKANDETGQVEMHRMM